jgi:hypothetical protein
LYGPDGQWKDEEKDEVKGKRVIEPCAQRKCPCGVNAKHGIVPSELGVGYYCGHVVGNDMVGSCVVSIFNVALSYC